MFSELMWQLLNSISKARNCGISADAFATWQSNRNFTNFWAIGDWELMPRATSFLCISNQIWFLFVTFQFVSHQFLIAYYFLTRCIYGVWQRYFFIQVNIIWSPWYFNVDFQNPVSSHDRQFINCTNFKAVECWKCVMKFHNCQWIFASEVFKVGYISFVSLIRSCHILQLGRYTGSIMTNCPFSSKKDRR